MFVMDWGAFVRVGMPFGLKNVPPTYQTEVDTTFKDYFDDLMELLLDNLGVYCDINNHLVKLMLCFMKSMEYGISLNLGIRKKVGLRFVLTCPGYDRTSREPTIV